MNTQDKITEILNRHPTRKQLAYALACTLFLLAISSALTYRFTRVASSAEDTLNEVLKKKEQEESVFSGRALRASKLEHSMLEESVAVKFRVKDVVLFDKIGKLVGEKFSVVTFEKSLYPYFETLEDKIIIIEGTLGEYKGQLQIAAHVKEQIYEKWK